MDWIQPSEGQGTGMGLASRRQRQRQPGPYRGQEVATWSSGKSMPAGEEGLAPESALPRAGMGHVGQREEGCRLAAREQPQRMLTRMKDTLAGLIAEVDRNSER